MDWKDSTFPAMRDTHLIHIYMYTHPQIYDTGLHSSSDGNFYLSLERIRLKDAICKPNHENE